MENATHRTYNVKKGEMMSAKSVLIFVRYVLISEIVCNYWHIILVSRTESVLMFVCEMCIEFLTCLTLCAY